MFICILKSMNTCKTEDFLKKQQMDLEQFTICPVLAAKWVIIKLSFLRTYTSESERKMNRK